MHPQRSRRPLALSVLVALGLFTMAGCSSLPTAPTPEAGGESVTASTSSRHAEEAGLLSGVGDLVEGVVGLLIRTVEQVVGADGGIVKAGRFSVNFPSGAFEGVGEVSVTVPDNSIMLVDLHITGVPNRFSKPVKLEVSYAGALDRRTKPENLRIFWLDESARVWRELPTTLNKTNGTVSTPLSHFSKYKVAEAKAGW